MHPSDLLLATLRAKRRGEAVPSADAWRTCPPQGLAELVQYEGCAYWTSRKLADLGLLNTTHAAFRSFLEIRARLSAEHNLKVRAEVVRLVKALDNESIPHVLLKGAALLQLAHEVPYADARLIGDIDLLVPAEAAQHAWSRLRACGYRTARDYTAERFTGHHHLAPLYGRDGIGIEVHTSISQRVAADHVWQRMSAGARQISLSGAVTHVPAPTELVWHAMAHALSDPRYGFRIRQLQDVAVLASAGCSIDWEAVAARAQSTEVADPGIAWRWLATARYLTDEVPEHIARNSAPFNLPRALRWRLFVFRNLRLTSRDGGVAVTRPDTVSRARRLLIDEGTGAELHRRFTPRQPCHGMAMTALRQMAARAARGAYRTWRMASPGRSASA